MDFLRAIAIAGLALVLVILAGAARPAGAVVPGANGRIVFESNAGGTARWLWVMNADGSGLVRLTQGLDGDDAPSFSPDARRVAYESGSTDVTVVNVDGSDARFVTQASSEGDPDWSPDGQRLVFESERFKRGEPELFTIAADGSSERRITNNTVFDGDPAWSPDGTRIAFTTLRDGNKEIYVIGADGSNPVRLTANAGTVADPLTQFVDENAHWSPDGTKIVFDSTRDGNFEVYVMNADGSGQRRLTDHPAIDANPAFSPDGRFIVFDGDRDQAQNRELYVMNADGSGVVRLTNRPGDDIAPDWGVAVQDPRGCTILGTVNDDVIVGTERADKICGLGGNDSIFGLGGYDFILGDAGRDVLVGGAGRDILYGGADGDNLIGGLEDDKLFGEAGNDRLAGGAGNDRLQGHGGMDGYLGDAGNDSVYARDGKAETVNGGAGRDRAQLDPRDKPRSIEKRF